MRKISQLENEAAIEVLGEILEPVSNILTDNDIRAIITSGGAPIAAIKIACKKYAHDLLVIMAAIDGVNVKDFECNIFTLPALVMDTINDEQLKDFFISQLQGITQLSMQPADDISEKEA